MNRYFCVYYNTMDRTKVSKENKITKVIETENWAGCLDKINNEFNCKFIKYIRDLENPIPLIRNIELTEIEMDNNERLKFQNND